MSHFDNAHNTAPYNNGDKPLTGQRFAKVLFKERLVNGVKVKPQNIAVSVPLISNEEIVSRSHQLVTAVRMMLEDAQDKIVREQVIAGKTLINGADISIDACIQYLNEEATGNRLTKEMISSWFADGVAEQLTVAFAQKLGVGVTPTAEEAAKVQAIVGEYEKKLAMLAGGKTQFSADVADKLLKALEIAGVDDDIAEKFNARLQKMKEMPKEDLMLGL